jgi:hypothetical protein
MNPILSAFDRRFRDLDSRSRTLLRGIPPDRLFWQPRSDDAMFPENSCGEYILRSAAAVEQAAGGITARLWDDPFEWTQPEALSTPESVLGYLDDAEAARVRAFAFIGSDSELAREIPAPEKLKPLFEIILDALVRGEHFGGRAAAAFRLIGNGKPPVPRIFAY